MLKVDTLYTELQWMHFCFTYTPPLTLELFKDGISIESVMSGTSDVTSMSSNDLALGDKYSDLNQNNGQPNATIDDVTVWQQGLTSQEIWNIYNTY